MKGWKETWRHETLHSDQVMLRLRPQAEDWGVRQEQLRPPDICGIQGIMDYRPTSDDSLPDSLTAFMLWQDNQEAAIKVVLLVNHRPLTSSSTHVLQWAGLMHVKLLALMATPRHMLKAYVRQLTEVLPDIFNLSLVQAAVPTCFKTTSTYLGQKTPLQRALKTLSLLHSPHHLKVLQEAGPG